MLWYFYSFVWSLNTEHLSCTPSARSSIKSGIVKETGVNPWKNHTIQQHFYSTLDQFKVSKIKEVEIIFARKLLKPANGSLCDKWSGQMSTLLFINIVLMYCGWHKERWKLIFNPVICDATDGGVGVGTTGHWWQWALWSRQAGTGMQVINFKIR